MFLAEGYVKVEEESQRALWGRGTIWACPYDGILQVGKMVPPYDGILRVWKNNAPYDKGYRRCLLGVRPKTLPIA